jgi:diacylglycerol kinase (ATP)
MRRSIKRQQQQQQQQQTSSTTITTSSSLMPYKTFIIRPLSTNNMKPLIILINPKSGGNLGNKLLKKFMWLLNPRQVFDLSQLGNPKFALELYKHTPNLRLLVGGGDGTVGWVLSVIDQINFKSTPPAVAVLPLGTGNDLSRVLNWGSSYTDEPLNKILTKISNARCVKLDRWKIFTEPNIDSENEGGDVSNSLGSISNNNQGYDKLKNDVMNNYFSIGADAHVTLEFHERRG